MPLRGRVGLKYLWCCGCQRFLDPSCNKSLKQHFRVVHRLEYQSGCPVCFTVRYRPGDVERHCWLVHGINLRTALPSDGCKWFLCKAKFGFKTHYPSYNDIPEEDFCEYPLPEEDITIKLQVMLASNSVSTSAVFNDPKLSLQAVVRLVKIPPSSSSSDSSPAVSPTRQQKDNKGGKSSTKKKASGKPKKSRYTSVGTMRWKAVQESTTEYSSDESERAGPSGACQSAGTISSATEGSPPRSPHVIPASMLNLPGFVSEDTENTKGAQTNISYSPQDKWNKNSKHQL